MAKRYEKNERGVYKLSQNENYVILIFSLFIGAIISIGLAEIVKHEALQFLKYGSIVLFLGLTIWRSSAIVKRLIRAKTLGSYLTELSTEMAIRKSLIDTMTVNRLKDTPFVEVPDIVVYDDRPSHISVMVEKLAGMHEIDKLIEDINASLRGKLKDYAVSSAMALENGTEYRFKLENVGADKTWKPSLTEIAKIKKYHLKLQKGLIIDLAKRPHIAVWGKTGSKKTTVLLGIIHQLFSMGADVHFIDGKNEFYSFTTFYEADKIADTVSSALRTLQEVRAIVEVRQRTMAVEAQNHKRMGLTASDLNYRPIVLIADEIGSVVALMDNKQSKEFVSLLMTIIQRGRSVGVSVIVSTQDPSTDTLPQKIRQQFSTKILLGSTNSDIQRMAFGEVATVGNVEDFRGFYTSDGLTTQPSKFYVNDIYSRGLNRLESFEKSYKIGQGVKYISEQ